MNIYIDIETVPTQDEAVRQEIEESIQHPGNISKPETIAAWHAEKKPAIVDDAWRKTALNGALGHICCIGVTYENNDVICFADGDFEANEKLILTAFMEFVKEKCSQHPNVTPTFIGHNLINFDIPFIFKRCVILGIKPSVYFPFGVRPWDDSVFDTTLRWDSKNFIKLDSLARAMGIPGKNDMDGSKVWDYVKDGRIDEVIEYCRKDVVTTRSIYKRMTFEYTDIVELA